MKKIALVLILWMGVCGLFTGQVLAGTESMYNTLFGWAAGVNLTDGTDNTRKDHC
jgi:hypothetical protein